MRRAAFAFVLLTACSSPPFRGPTNDGGSGDSGGSEGSDAGSGGSGGSDADSGGSGGSDAGSGGLGGSAGQGGSQGGQGGQGETGGSNAGQGGSQGGQGGQGGSGGSNAGQGGGGTGGSNAGQGGTGGSDPNSCAGAQDWSPMFDVQRPVRQLCIPFPLLNSACNGHGDKVALFQCLAISCLEVRPDGARADRTYWGFLKECTP